MKSINNKPNIRSIPDIRFFVFTKNFSLSLKAH